MKNAMKKAMSLLLVLMIFASVLLLPGCRQDKLVIEDSEPQGSSQPTESTPNGTNEELVVKVSDTCIVIKTTEDSLNGKTDMLLIDYMKELKEKGELEFSISDGMITSINGIDNPADFSSCWMLYTSDEDNANAAWGIVEYKEKEYGSAVAGAETLKIKPDQLYIWVFKSF